MSFKNRINKEVKTQPASQFLAHPDNPKIHPQSQRDALNIALNELGYVAPAIVNVRTGYLVDGHERVWQALQNDDSDVPYIEIDVDESEERAILATLDPIGMMAQHDGDMLAGLLGDIDFDVSFLGDFLNDVTNETSQLLDNEPVKVDNQYLVLIECHNEQHQNEIVNQLIEQGIECKALIS